MSEGAPREREIAYLLFRVMLGINICLHGVTRLAGGDAKFAGGLISQFAHTALPHPLLVAFAYILPWAEAILGFLITLGLLTRSALAAGFLLMILLTFGTCLLQEWPVAGTQLIYGIAYAALLWALACNRYSVDAVLRRSNEKMRL